MAEPVQGLDMMTLSGSGTVGTPGTVIDGSNSTQLSGMVVDGTVSTQIPGMVPSIDSQAPGYSLSAGSNVVEDSICKQKGISLPHYPVIIFNINHIKTSYYMCYSYSRRTREATEAYGT